MNSRELTPSASLLVPRVDPAVHYVSTDLLVTPGASYRFIAYGRWRDWWITCGPDGWPGLFLEAGCRLPWKHFFLLCGCIGEDLRFAFPIGSHRDWTAPPAEALGPDRELRLFANDWPGRYGNNRELSPLQGGPLFLTITRIS